MSGLSQITVEDGVEVDAIDVDLPSRRACFIS